MSSISELLMDCFNKNKQQDGSIDFIGFFTTLTNLQIYKNSPKAFLANVVVLLLFYLNSDEYETFSKDYFLLFHQKKDDSDNYYISFFIKKNIQSGGGVFGNKTKRYKNKKNKKKTKMSKKQKKIYENKYKKNKKGGFSFFKNILAFLPIITAGTLRSRITSTNTMQDSMQKCFSVHNYLNFPPTTATVVDTSISTCNDTSSGPKCVNTIGNVGLPSVIDATNRSAVKFSQSADAFVGPGMEEGNDICYPDVTNAIKEAVEKGYSTFDTPPIHMWKNVTTQDTRIESTNPDITVTNMTEEEIINGTIFDTLICETVCFKSNVYDSNISPGLSSQLCIKTPNSDECIDLFLKFKKTFKMLYALNECNYDVNRTPTQMPIEKNRTPTQMPIENILGWKVLEILGGTALFCICCFVYCKNNENKNKSEEMIHQPLISPEMNEIETNNKMETMERLLEEIENLKKIGKDTYNTELQLYTILHSIASLQSAWLNKHKERIKNLTNIIFREEGKILVATFNYR